MITGFIKVKFGSAAYFCAQKIFCRFMKSKIRVLLIDDEAPCRDALRAFLMAGCPEAEIIGEAASLKEALDLIPRLEPDIVLLDLALEDGTGFDLLDHFPKPNFRVIFTTGFDNFALRAFRYSAVDYLLKPVDPTELIEAVLRAAIPMDQALRHRQLNQLRQSTATQNFDRITLNTGDGLIFIRTAEITHLEANGNYSFVFLENNERHLAAQSLATFEEILPSPPFFRAHQSHIVNTAFVRKLTRDEGDNLMMLDKTLIPLARRRKDAFFELMASGETT